jgi:Spy/CpxP family protein refolding chaperone
MRGAALLSALLAAPIAGFAAADGAPTVVPGAAVTGSPGGAVPAPAPAQADRPVPATDGATPPPVRRRDHGPQGPAQVLDEHVRALAKSLELDAKQQADLRQILIQERAAVLEMRRNGAGGGQDYVTASRAIVARTRDGIRALLTPEQRKKFFTDVPEDSLAPAQADRDKWLEAAHPKPAAGGAPATPAQ